MRITVFIHTDLEYSIKCISAINFQCQSKPRQVRYFTHKPLMRRSTNPLFAA